MRSPLTQASNYLLTVPLCPWWVPDSDSLLPYLGSCTIIYISHLSRTLQIPFMPKYLSKARVQDYWVRRLCPGSQPECPVWYTSSGYVMEHRYSICRKNPYNPELVGMFKTTFSPYIQTCLAVSNTGVFNKNIFAMFNQVRLLTFTHDSGNVL